MVASRAPLTHRLYTSDRPHDKFKQVRPQTLWSKVLSKVLRRSSAKSIAYLKVDSIPEQNQQGVQIHSEKKQLHSGTLEASYKSFPYLNQPNEEASGNRHLPD